MNPQRRPTLLLLGLVLLLAASPTPSAAAPYTLTDPNFITAAMNLNPGNTIAVAYTSQQQPFTTTADASAPTTIITQLKRIAIWNADAPIIAGGKRVPVPSTAFFHTINTTPSPSSSSASSYTTTASKMVLQINEDGSIRGMELQGDQGIWSFKTDAGSASTLQTIDSSSASSSDGSIPQSFNCGADALKGKDGLKLSPSSVFLSDKGGIKTAAVTGDTILIAPIAVEADYAYTNLFSTYPDPAKAALDYIGYLFTTSSMVFSNDANVQLQLAATVLHTTAAQDPYPEQTNIRNLLDQFQANWNGSTELNTISRATAMLVTGKSVGGGIAYIGCGIPGNTSTCSAQILCGYHTRAQYGPDYINYGYGVAGVGNEAPYSTSGWGYYVITHELGHNFGSQHSHNYCGTYGNDNPVDHCVVNDANYGITDSCCSNGTKCGVSGTTTYPTCTYCSAAALPSCTDGFVPGVRQGPGTIMSYCHFYYGMDKIAPSFGRNFKCGNQPDRVPNAIRAYVESLYPYFPSCFQVLANAPANPPPSPPPPIPPPPSPRPPPPPPRPPPRPPPPSPPPRPPPRPPPPSPPPRPPPPSPPPSPPPPSPPPSPPPPSPPPSPPPPSPPPRPPPPRPPPPRPPPSPPPPRPPPSPPPPSPPPRPPPPNPPPRPPPSPGPLRGRRVPFFPGDQGCGRSFLKGKSASQSSTWSNRKASNAVNGDCRTDANTIVSSCSGTPASKNSEPWWTVSLGKKNRIKYVAITAASDAVLASALGGAEVYVGSGVWKVKESSIHGKRRRNSKTAFKLCAKVPKVVGKSQRVILKCGGDSNGLEGNRIVVYLLKKKSRLVLCEVDAA